MRAQVDTTALILAVAGIVGILVAASVVGVFSPIVDTGDAAGPPSGGGTSPGPSPSETGNGSDTADGPGNGSGTGDETHDGSRNGSGSGAPGAGSDSESDIGSGSSGTGGNDSAPGKQSGSENGSSPGNESSSGDGSTPGNESSSGDGSTPGNESSKSSGTESGDTTETPGDGSGGSGSAGGGGDDSLVSGGNTGGATIGGGSLQQAQRTRISGTLEGLSHRVVFTVAAAQPRYWRTKGFSTYTGQGWERSPETRPYSAPVVDRPETGTRDLVQRITPREPMAVVPMAWAPARVPDAVGQRARISETGSVLLDRPVPTNSTVRVVSRVRSPDPERLRRAGTDYPRALERTYTALPSSVPDRVEARTAEIAADAETPYATAVAIERYLEGSKTYSLEVSRPAGNVADAFLFEMDRGYCQYFATTMVVMLRTQGIPARYVTGFTPGQPVGEDTYVVRGMNAHAWVEVYFPDVGWVQFDPTPGGPRTDLEREAIEQARAQGLANVDAKGSRGEPLSFPSENASSPGESSGSKNPSKGSGSDDGESSDDSEGDGSEDNGSDRESDEKDATEPIRVDVHPDPVPGRVVTVTVTRGGDPVSGAVVRFNEETIGTTDGNGTVSGRVPYVRTLNVTVVPPDAVSQKPVSSRVVASGAGSSPVPDRWYSLEPPSIAAQPNRNSSKAPRATGGALAAGPAVHEVADNGTNTTTYELDTTIYLTVEDDLVPGRTVVFDATIDDVPVANARVVVDGQRRGRTNETGRIPVELPYRSNVTVRITRGAAELNRSISLRSGVDIDLRRPVAGTTRNLSATVGERPLRNATVRLDGERVGRTNATGSLPVSIPYRKNVTLAVSRGGLGTERNVSVEGDLSLEASGDVLPTREIRIDATLGGHPVGNATVSLDGTPTTRTNATGAASVVHPYEKNVTVTVRRGEFVENRTVRVDEPLSLSISGEWLPSRTVTLSATIGDVSVDNATVALDGTLTTRTNATGAASVVVPYRKNVTVTVRRGEFATSRTMRVEESLSLSLSGRKLPTRPITLDATIGGVPVRNATVAIGGDRAGVTGSNGEKTVSLPLANSVTIVVSRGEFGAETTLEWLLLPIALPVVALALLVGAWVAARRRGVSERLHPAWWGRLVALRALSALVFLSEFVARALALGSGLVDKLRRSFRQLLAAVRRAPTLRARLAVLADSVGRVAATLRRRLRHLLAAIREVDPTALLAAVSRLRSSGTAVSAPDGRRNSPVVAGESTGNDADQSFDVVAAWMWVEARSGVRDRRTKTPGEIAREAATRGWPRDSVETLLRAYRNVTYADRSLEPGHRSRARRAFERISSRRGTDVNERANAADNAEDGLEGGDRS